MAEMTQAEFAWRRAQLAAKHRYDPLGFAEDAWAWGEGPLEGEDIRAWQSEVMDEIAVHLSEPETRFNVWRGAVASGHGIGKSALTGMLTTWALACWENPRIVITANTESQLTTKTSPEVGQWVKTSLYGDLFDTETLSVKYRANPSQHRADFSTNSENNKEAFAGLHAKGRLVLMIVDEASKLPQAIYETILGALTDENTVLIFLMLGNPTSAHGAFREAFRKNRKFWHLWQIDSRDVEGVNLDALQAIIDEFGENSDQAKVRVRGMFPAASQHQFFPTPYIDAAFGRHLRKEQYSFAPHILTCDPAYEGDDLLVIGHRQGLFFEVLEVMEKNNDDIAVAAKLAMYEDRFNAAAVFIDAGYGTGIHSAGKAMGRGWTLVWFSSQADDPGYFNKRAEMHARARTWLVEGGAIPKIQRLYDDLVSIETKPNVMDKVQLRSKEDMKKKGLPSPDYSDALVLSFAYEVTSQQAIEAAQRAGAHRHPQSEVVDEVFTR